MPELWNIRRLCLYLGVSRATLYRLIKSGKIPKPDKSHTNTPRWNAEELKKILKVS